MAVRELRRAATTSDGEPVGLDRLFTAEELAKYLALPLGTIYRFNYAGTGPRPLKVGRHLRYRERDIASWLDKQAKDNSRAS